MAAGVSHPRQTDGDRLMKPFKGKVKIKNSFEGTGQNLYRHVSDKLKA